MNSKISVIMPTYNRGNSMLKDAVSSILNQSFTDFELIIIDDASQDNTGAIIKSFKDTRIRYYKTDYNHGEYWSTNYGVNMARAENLTWVHSDDLLPKDSLRLRAKVLDDNPGIDFVHGDIIKIDENGNLITKLGAVDWPKEKIFSEYLVVPKQRKIKYLLHHTTILMKWKFFYKAGPFDCSLPFAGDIDWLIRAIRIGEFKHIPQVLYAYRSHPQTRRVLDIKNGVNEEEINRMIIRRYEET